jgi:NADH-quinone oxidoreductase subunit N
MTGADLAVSLPLLIPSACAVVVMLATAVRRSHMVAAAISVVGLLLALASLPLASSYAPRVVSSLLIFDAYSFLYLALILTAAVFVFLFSYGYLEGRQEHREEFYMLVLLATVGAMVLAASRHFASFFLGLELLSVALYALIAYIRSESASIEAGIKYLVLAASSSSILLFGLALIYSESGSMDLAQFASVPPTRSVVLLAGIVMGLAGVGFKLAVVPFHLWTPDVYEGAPLPATAFIATVSKGGMFALLLRWIHVAGGRLSSSVVVVLAVLAIA